jgi:hypothetical protein
MRDPNLCSRFAPTDKCANEELSTIEWGGRDNAVQNLTFDLIADNSHSASHQRDGTDILQSHSPRDIKRGQFLASAA